MEKNEIIEAEKNNIADKDNLDARQQAIAEAINPNQKFNLDLDDTLSQQVKYIQTMFGEYFFMDLKGQNQLLHHITRGFAIAQVYAEKSLQQLVKDAVISYHNRIKEELNSVNVEYVSNMKSTFSKTANRILDKILKDFSNDS